MSIYQIIENTLQPAEETDFVSEGIRERQHIQAMLRESIYAIAEDVMVLAEEFGGWEDSRRRIDLLCLDREARLVVVELKRTEDGGHMELQAIRYAAMISKMTFAAAVEAHKSLLKRQGRDDESAEANILAFLGWEDVQEEVFASDVRLVLVSHEFSKELMTAVIWLSEHEIDISCVKLKPYKLGDALLLDVQQIFPLPEASDYQVRIREKERRERQVRMLNRDLTRFDLIIGDTTIPNLSKLRLGYLVVKEAISRGASPREVLPGSAWVAIASEHTQESFLGNEAGGRDPESSGANIGSFLTKDDELILWDGKTYALRNNRWGPKTREELDQIIEKFDLEDVSFRSAD